VRFSDKVAIVTGGAGAVGRALVRTLLREGAAVMVADVSVDGCRSLVDDITATGGGAVAYVAGDLRDRSYCERVVEETVARWGGVDILFNNAGIIPRGTILETSDDMWRAALDVNLTAMFYLCRAVIPAMKERGGGAIVNTSSVWGVYLGPGHIAYCTARGRWPPSRRAWGVITRPTASGSTPCARTRSTRRCCAPGSSAGGWIRSRAWRS
jgi:meso-butanediol dehydrogenase / (S,S)-butanediol dehydrogenase / diacetyl reductase